MGIYRIYDLFHKHVLTSFDELPEDKTFRSD